jgi:hypothetical protein
MKSCACEALSTLSYKNSRKMLMKLAIGVNFNNILRAHFAVVDLIDLTGDDIEQRFSTQTTP